MTDRHLLIFIVLTMTAENVGELVANWPRPAEVERDEQHRRMVAEVRAKLEERGR